jgi:asparagine synthase (glutamine-hydrolysing)
MAFGLEARVPLLDHRIVEFGLALPDSVKMRGKVGKAPLRWWAARRLPAAHINRKKRGFHVPTGAILTDAFVRALGQKLRHHPTVTEWFSAPGIDRLTRSVPSPHRNRMLWSLMQFGLWSNLLIENPGRTPSSDEDPLAWL